MVDALIAALILLSFLAAGMAYAILVLRRGRIRSRRVEKDGGSFLLPKGVMEVGHWVLGPLGRFLAHAGVAPNTVTGLSLVLACAAAAAIAGNHLGIAALLSTLSFAGDVLDGMVARETQSESMAGEIVDTTADRYGEMAILLGFGLWLHESQLLVGLVVMAVAGAFMTTYASALTELAGVPAPRGTLRRPERAVLLLVAMALVPLLRFAAGPGPTVAWISLWPVGLALLALAVGCNVSAVHRLAVLARNLRKSETQDSVIVVFDEESETFFQGPSPPVPDQLG